MEITDLGNRILDSSVAIQKAHMPAPLSSISCSY